jgi:hypothetical protein
MGGLIVTTVAAMRDGWAQIGETNPGWTFQVDHVTTMDTPHGGVYIPQAIFHLASRFQRGLRDPVLLPRPLGKAVVRKFIDCASGRA